MADKKKHAIETEYWFGDIVFLRVNSERNPGMVNTIQLTSEEGILFGVTFKDRHTYHFARELTVDFVPVFDND